ncbi:MAG TPA: VOC family protein [bacterium]|jgi:predicted 3-demethylubiquinone-9 3-methyltransferase (glyoxalase superfamily)
MQRITPCLWFDSQAEGAAQFYVDIFTALGKKDSRILNVARYGEEGSKAAGRPKGTVMVVEYELEGQKFTALNGGPHFKFTEAVSFVINCQTQKEVDYYWEKLSEGGDERAQQCGWLKDKYGLSWQVVPTALVEMLQDKDPKKSERVMQAMLQMKKLDIQTLQDAYDGR